MNPLSEPGLFYSEGAALADLDDELLANRAAEIARSNGRFASSPGDIVQARRELLFSAPSGTATDQPHFARITPEGTA